MLPKEASSTKSSRSATAKGLDTPVQFVKGVGPKLSAIFSKRDIHTVRDLLYFLPRTFENRKLLPSLEGLSADHKASVQVKVVGTRRIPTRTGKTILEIRTTDGKGYLLLKYFHFFQGTEKQFQIGREIIVSGKLNPTGFAKEIIHPEIHWKPEEYESITDSPWTPIYTEIEGIPSRTLQKVIQNALLEYSLLLRDPLPPKFIAKYDFPKLSLAINELHNPSEKDLLKLQNAKTPAQSRMIYEEFFLFQLMLIKNRVLQNQDSATQFNTNNTLQSQSEITKTLPFELTDGQKAALQDILGDMNTAKPMNRLLMGDVGSGKTIVALIASAIALGQSSQAVFLAPTEILAEQHFHNAKKFLAKEFDIRMLTASTSASDRNKLLRDLSNGLPCLVIGTHAILEDDVRFRNLDLVIIDEQQRFGVDQRRVLRSKGSRRGTAAKTLSPHTLILTATPIPRTLALTVYGELSVSAIRERPPGRKPIVTRVVYEKDKPKAFDSIRKELESGRQAYFIFPLVNESEAEGFKNLKAATEQFEELRTLFPTFQSALLHGQMKNEEKIEIMAAFKRGEVQILVSTSLVEVGVDVPNATVMVIENSERFGLSQLHQLRGRIGRGEHSSRCYLFATFATSETAEKRLDVMEATEDGFKIAEADLEIRGPGEFLGTRQSGQLPFRIANLVRDQLWLERAREDTLELLKSDPELKNPENKPLLGYFQEHGNLQEARLKTS